VTIIEIRKNSIVYTRDGEIYIMKLSEEEG